MDWNEQDHCEIRKEILRKIFFSLIYNKSFPIFSSLVSNFINSFMFLYCNEAESTLKRINNNKITNWQSWTFGSCTYTKYAMLIELCGPWTSQTLRISSLSLEKGWPATTEAAGSRTSFTFFLCCSSHLHLSWRELPVGSPMTVGRMSDLPSCSPHCFQTETVWVGSSHRKDSCCRPSGMSHVRLMVHSSCDHPLMSNGLP